MRLFLTRSLITSSRQIHFGPENLRYLSRQKRLETARTAFGPNASSEPRVNEDDSFVMRGKIGSMHGDKRYRFEDGKYTGVVTLRDPNGKPLVTTDAATCTTMRTADAAALATSLMADENAKVFAMIGAGSLAFEQVLAVLHVRPSIQEIYLWSRSTPTAQHLANRLQKTLGDKKPKIVVVSEVQAAVKNADIITVATRSKNPLFEADHVKSNVHINAMGVFSGKDLVHEIPTALLRRAFVIVDDLASSLREAGDLAAAGKQPDGILASLASGALRIPSGQSTVFRSVGTAAQDIAFAELARQTFEPVKKFVTTLPRAASLPSYRGTNNEIHTIHLPPIVAMRFLEFFEKFPRFTEQFQPNFQHNPSEIYRYSQLAALVLATLLRQHAPEVLDALFDLEISLKGLTLKDAPHVVFKGVPCGDKPAYCATSDNPQKDSKFFNKDNRSEAALLAFNTLLGMDVLPITPEKGGTLIHHHVPIKANATSGTSVSFMPRGENNKTYGIAPHTEDFHYAQPHASFWLKGELGHQQALTPLWTMESFLSQFPVEILKGMELNFAARPGAGRFDEASLFERSITPLIFSNWAGLSTLVCNLSKYSNIRYPEEHIQRIMPLSPELYRSNEDHERAVAAVEHLYNTAVDIDQQVQRKSPWLFPLSISREDLILLSNRGPHARTSFADPLSEVPTRYVQRLYSDRPNIFSASLNFTNQQQRYDYLREQTPGMFSAAQQSHIAGFLGVNVLPGLRSQPSDLRFRDATHVLFDTVRELIYINRPLDHFGVHQDHLRSLRAPLTTLHQTLRNVAIKRRQYEIDLGQAEQLVVQLHGTIKFLQTLAFRPTSKTMHQEIDRVGNTMRLHGAAIAAAVNETSERLRDL
jgi:ornithine cyclodeaminase/alanine dehydrogenase-like protein (mu-crystallin family)